MDSVQVLHNGQLIDLHQFPANIIQATILLKNRLGIQHPLIQYIDEDQDIITVQTQQEYEEALSYIKKTSTHLQVIEESNSDALLALNDSQIYSSIVPPTIDRRPSELVQQPSQVLLQSQQFNEELTQLISSTIRSELRRYLAQPESRACPTIHQGTICQKCDASPIIGVCYRCAKCDIDVCQVCEDGFDHHHPMLKLKKEYPKIKAIPDPRIRSLLGLGFTDIEMCSRVLEECKGDVDMAAARLLNLE